MSEQTMKLTYFSALLKKLPPDTTQHSTILALDVAVEAVALAVMTVSGDQPQCQQHLRLLDATVERLAVELAAPVVEKVEDVPVALPDWMGVA